jgi:WD repeat-containing protein 19
MRKLYRVGSDRHDVGPVQFAWHPEGNLLASVGKNGIVQITDRHGDIIDELPMSSGGPILNLAWDKDGEYLAILQEGNGQIPLWCNSTRRVTPLDTNFKDPTFIAWSKTGPQLAVGTGKGNLLIYNKTKKQKIPIIGKHGKRISCGSWSKSGNKLALGSDDKNLTISNDLGDTLLHTEFKNVCWNMDFSLNRYLTPSNKLDDMVCANLGGKSLLLFGIGEDAEDPTELTFSSADNKNTHYGDILSAEFFDGGSLILGFSKGFLVIVSTGASGDDMGEEKHVGRFHMNSMQAFTYNPSLRRAATCGFDGVRIVDTRDFREISTDFISLSELEDGRVCDLKWSPDGTILTIATESGNVYNFLAKMSVLNATSGTSIAYLSSLREASIMDSTKSKRTIDIPLKLEPTFLALGPKYLAAGMNNKVYYHRATDKNTSVVHDQDYMGSVKDVILNSDFAAVLMENKAILHPIETADSDTRNKFTKTFPERSEGTYSEITCIALTENFFYYGTEGGKSLLVLS